MVNLKTKKTLRIVYKYSYLNQLAGQLVIPILFKKLSKN